jgi:glycosyltransferase involved in cell wall biosynthesis
VETTIHLVYPHGDKVSCPDAIGRHLAAKLSRRYRVVKYDFHIFGKIRPGPNDVLVGHPFELYMTLFRRSCRAQGWKRVLLMSPFCHGDDYQIAYIERLIRYCDLYLAITGNYWFSGICNSGFAHWLPKMRHLDLAVDRTEFPVLKRRFNPPGSRKFLFIGRTGVTGRLKNTQYLADIASAMPDVEFGWIGTETSIGNVRALGQHDFRTEESRKLVGEYDFFLTVGHIDANPVTILEAMAWGLIPVCTPQSGYCGHEGIVNVPLASVGSVVEILRGLQDAPDAALAAKQRSNWEALDRHFNWDRFAAQVVEAIESPASPPCLPVSFKRKRELMIAELKTPTWANLLNPRRAMRRLRMVQFMSKV